MTVAEIQHKTVYRPCAPRYSNSTSEEYVAAPLVLKNGDVYFGYSFGAKKSICGECVFQTGMVGYPESLTDPSYKGQILVVTYPMVGNYGVPPLEKVKEEWNNLPEYFESSKVQVSGLVIANYCSQYSHYLATSSLAQWLKDSQVPAIFGVDTRALTKTIRTEGSLLAQLLCDRDSPSLSYDQIVLGPWNNPNADNLVASVSRMTPTLYKSASISPLRLVLVDFGMKNNQIRCFLKRGAQVLVVPWDYDFNAVPESEFDGLFLSNGPGDPQQLLPVVERIKLFLERKSKPVFGICLGHQLLALAAGAKTVKMKFGNRGHNIPCTDLETGRCYITSQNHGFAVDAATLPSGWREYFVNANDNSNEGICHETLPYFSVQFHPESAPGPWDVEFLFDKFLSLVKQCKDAGKLVSRATNTPAKCVPPREDVKKVLILGSGGLSIGQAGEFDYSGSQAIKALKGEGIYTILINPNIATIQTSPGLADKVYFLPVTPQFVLKVLKYEQPDGIYCTFGGQTALNVGIKLKNEFKKLNVKVLGTPIETIELTEDRELFAKAMLSIGEQCARSASATNVEEALQVARSIGFPLIVRAAYALGGLGSGFADNESELISLCEKAFANSPQVLVERSMKGWKEIEYEVVRDAMDNCITVCNMENFDPLGIHTGDSIVVAPSQTLSDLDYMMLRRTAVNVVRHLGVVGECNIQYALNPLSQEYAIIEVNARLSRSSALASKATGYPLAYVAAKLGLGIPLSQIKNSVTQKTIACFEPSLDYCVVKMPRWDLAKFVKVSNKISSSMKSVGEVMSIGRSFEEAIQKAIRCIDYNLDGFSPNLVQVSQLEEELRNPSDQRLLAIANAFHAGMSVEDIHELTHIDRWFLNKLSDIVKLDRKFSLLSSAKQLDEQTLREAKLMGFADRQLAKRLNTSELIIRRMRKDWNITPFVKQIDTVAAEFPCFTNYLYMTYHASTHDVEFAPESSGIMVLGSGVYRIGSSVEFDWCAVRSIRTLRSLGKPTIMVNFNPETVSTDYDEADRLYFESLDTERVLDIYEQEGSAGIIVSMGGQTPNNIALPLFRAGANILGTSPEMIDSAENRYKFSRLLDKMGVDQPQWKELTSIEEARSFCDKVGYPVLVRPSYVLSGAGMTVVYSSSDLSNYLLLASTVSKDFPVVISKFIEEAKEIELDGVSLDGEMFCHVISEHVENAGVHSGDATLVLPPQDLDPSTVSQIETAAKQIAYGLNVTGPFNIQFIAKNNAIKVIECNVRASRSFPFVSKVTGVDLAELATKAMLGIAVKSTSTVLSNSDRVAVKVPQFSFSRLSGADPILGVEMASTGEVACFGRDKFEAYLKALVSTGFVLPEKNILLSIGSFKEKLEFLPSVRKLHDLGFRLYATSGTADFYQEHDIPVQMLEVLPTESKLEYSLNQHLSNNLIDLYINLPSRNQFRRPASYISRGYKSRRLAVDFSIPLITNIKCAKLFVAALGKYRSILELPVSNRDSQSSHVVQTFSGFVQPIVSCKPVQELGCELLQKGVLASLILSNAYDSEEAYRRGIDAWKENGVPLNVAIYFSPKPTCPVEYVLEHHLLYLDMSTFTYSPSFLLELFKKWKFSTPIVVKATGYALGALLFQASNGKAPVHLVQVETLEDLALIESAKQTSSASITCDASVSTLMSSPEWWMKRYAVDVWTVFSSNMYSFYEYSSKNGCDSELLLADLNERAIANPIAVFRVENWNSTDHSIELDWDQSRHLVHRIVVRGETVFIDGKISQQPFGTSFLAIGKHALPATELKDEAKAHLANKIVSSEIIEKRRASLLTPLAANTAAVTLASPTVQQTPLGNVSESIRIKTNFHRQSLVSCKSLGRSDLHLLFNAAQEMKLLVERRGCIDVLANRVMVSAFLEPSTRTMASFETAMLRLGGKVVTINGSTSSVAKGESLHDTMQTVGCYADVVVLRHPDKGAAQLAVKSCRVPVINAGDGVGEHPTQALLDVFTIREELGTVNGLTVTLLGDLKNGRTAHSLVRVLSMYDVRLQLVSPPSLALPQDIIALLDEMSIPYIQCSSIENVIPNTDVLYVTRVQKERFTSAEEYEKVANCYKVNNELLSLAKSQMIVMHPLPRINEIDPEVDVDQRAAYFRQMRYGLYVRMALLALILS